MTQQPSFFGTEREVLARFERLYRSPLYAKYCAPGVEERLERERAQRVKLRKRKPTLRGVLAQAKRAGVAIASIELAPDGRIVVVPGKPVTELQIATPADANPWDAVLQ
jgi:hypothetical protein